MHEITITLDHIDTRELFGPANAYIDRVNAKFPTLKVVVRGGVIRVAGAHDQIMLYQSRLGELLDYFNKYGHLSAEVIDRLYDRITTSAPTAAATTGGENAGEKNDILVYGNNGNLVRARTKHQLQLVAAYEKNDLLFAIGPAGSGKTYTAIALAVRAWRNKEIKRIILTRPAVEAGEKLGFLPGDMKEKLDPYLQPLYDALGDMIPSKKLADLMDEGIVQIAPLAYMRGRTLDNACVILDEAQNTTREQLKMFLTRMGRSAKFIVTGDLTQIDLPNRSESGLQSTLDRLGKIKGISVVMFSAEDILRHPLVGKIVEAMEQPEGSAPTSAKTKK